MTAIACERRLIGALLLSPSWLDEPSFALDYSTSAFEDPAMRIIATAIGAISGMHDVVDVVTVADKLAQWGQLDQVGGLAELVALQADCPRTTAAPRYLEEILRWG